MRLDINLATHRYEDAQQFWIRWGTGLCLLVIATIALLFITISGWNNARLDRNKIAELQSKIAERDKERADAEALLNRPENRSMRDKSQYLNELIQRKTFSWTKAFEDLEQVMPPRIHLVSIQPELNDDNQLAIKMQVAGDSSDRAIELVRRMEDSRHFRETRIETYGAASQQAGGDTVQFAINALYVPAPDQPAHAEPTHAQPANTQPAHARPVHGPRGAK
jgi:type IV pilus assembly protein PilN